MLAEPRITSAMLAQLPLFRGEQADALEWLVDRCRVSTVTAGTVLLTPSKSNDIAFILLSGRLDVRLDSNGEQTHTYLEEGACVGEMSIIEGAPPSATVIADMDSVVLELEGEVLWAAINRSHAVARNLLYTLSSRVRNDNKAILESIEQQRLHERSARIDPLTNLGNRRWLSEMLPRLMERCVVDKNPLSILMLDVDHFKKYNDTQGHIAGDCALRIVGEVIQNNIRPTDAAARYGGEEFVVVMPETDAAQARTIAQRLCDAMREQKIVHESGSTLPGITVSIGIADTSHFDDPVELPGNIGGQVVLPVHGSLPG